jgi:hypothetical protein
VSERSDGDPGEERKARSTPGEGRKPRSTPGEDPKPKTRPGGGDKPKAPSGGMSPTARRHARRRKEQLDLIREQVKDGSLVIRQMTPEERKKYPPRPRKPKRSDRKR